MSSIAEVRKEWQASGVSDEIISLNVRECSGKEAFDIIFGNSIKQTDRRQSTGNPPNAYWMRKLNGFIRVSGWIVSGVDWQNNFETDSEWTRFKATTGQLYRLQDKSGKIPKYFSPATPAHPDENHLPWQAMYLKVGDKDWEKIAKVNGVERKKSDVFFWKWVRDNNIKVVITEGEKKAACLLSNGIVAIAAPGIWMLTRRKGEANVLIPDIEMFDTPGRHIGILFDYESDPKKRETVLQAAFRGAYAFKKATAKIAFTPAPHKGIDDYIVAGGKGKDIKFTCPSKLRSEIDWRLSRVDLTVNQQYLDVPIPRHHRLICVKSSKGSGKTTLVGKVIDQRQKEENAPVLILSHRVTLGKALANKFGLPWVDEVSNYYRDENGKAVKGNFLGNGICFDSLHSNGQGKSVLSNSSKLVILDEVEQSIMHLLNSSTCQRYRVEILDNFRMELERASQVVCCDADLSDLTVKFLEQIMQTKAYVIENKHKPFQWQVTINEDSDPSAVMREIREAIAAGKTVWICTDSQKPGSKHGSMNIWKWLQKEFPDKKFLRIDQNTTADPKHEAYGCASNINEIVARKEYAALISSPSLTSGVSVDVRGCIDKVFGIFQGVGMPSDCMQALARVREPVERVIWLRKRGVGIIAGGELNPFRLHKRLDKVNKVNFNLLNEAQSIGAISDSTGTWCQFVTRNNFAFSHYREWVKNALIADGHIIKTFVSGDETKQERKEMKEEIKAIRNESVQEESQAIADAMEITETQFEDLSKKSTKTIDQQRQEKKHRLKKQYGVEINSQLVQLADTHGWHSSLMMQYYMTLGSCFMEKRDKQQIKSHVERGKGKVILHDLNLITAKVKTLEALNVVQFLEEDTYFYKRDPRVQEFMELCRRNRKNIQDVLGVTISESDIERRPMQIVQRLLQQIGLKLTSSQHTVNYKKEWRFTFTGELFHDGDSAELRAAIFQHWVERDSRPQMEEEVLAVA